MIIFQLISSVFMLGGTIFAAKKKRICWVSYSIGNVMWLYVCIKTQTYGYVPLAIIYVFLNIYGWLQWNDRPVRIPQIYGVERAVQCSKCGRILGDEVLSRERSMPCGCGGDYYRVPTSKN